MTVKKDASGRRSVEASVEVPGTPEEVWQAIATGPGISSWFVPSEVEEREGGRAVSHFAPGDSMDSVGTVTAWQPPHRFVVDTVEGPLTVASEWTVEARDGGTCVVRVVHSWFASTDDWDGQYEMAEAGWPAFFRILRAYLTHFRGRTGASFQLMGISEEPLQAAWRALIEPLGLGDAEVGARMRSPAGAPALDGTVDGAGIPDHPERLVRLDAPAPGLAHLFPLPMGKVYLCVRLYLYGPDAAATVARVEPEWQAWMAARFPPRETAS
jgi:uncharacterized protein YndB with AHSA1/START domain